MAAMQQVRIDEVPPQPWRNGGGVTRELLVWPPAPPWQVRISVADITADGPFSVFPGVDRWFAVMQGEGVELAFAQGVHVQGPDDAPLPFDGAAAPGCRLLGGATRDLNLMVLRSAGRGMMERVRAGVAWQSPASLRAVFTMDPLRLQVDAAELGLPAGTLLASTSAAGQRWCVPGAGGALRAWWLGFDGGAP